MKSQPHGNYRSVVSCFVSLILTILVTSNAHSDVKGSKDHPLISRYPNSDIVHYEKNYNEVEFATGPDGEKEAIEGDTVKISYFHNDRDSQPSPLQLIRNYQNAIKQIGGEVVYERKPADNDGGETTLKATADGKEFWISVTPDIFSAPTQSYKITVVERKAMEQVVKANKLLDELNKNGLVRLYINFDVDKATIKSDSIPVIDELAKMLQSAADLKISVEGHTDNSGSAAHNTMLSENRATSVVQALSTRGIGADRLSAKGFGQDRPIADNNSEAGRAKNRRVEIVKQS